jgi:hypothetical protein
VHGLVAHRHAQRRRPGSRGSLANLLADDADRTRALPIEVAVEHPDGPRVSWDELLEHQVRRRRVLHPVVQLERFGPAPGDRNAEGVGTAPQDPGIHALDHDREAQLLGVAARLFAGRREARLRRGDPGAEAQLVQPRLVAQGKGETGGLRRQAERLVQPGQVVCHEEGCDVIRRNEHWSTADPRRERQEHLEDRLLSRLG